MSSQEEEESIEFKGITFINHAITDQETYDSLPADLQEFFANLNGVVAYNGGFQMRGCISDPEYLSLFEAWKGEKAFYKTYSQLSKEDIPFAQDCMGDQFVYRSGSVWHLLTETGDLDDLELDFEEFIDEVTEDPIEFLALYPLIDFLEQGHQLHPGELLHPNIPFSQETNEEYQLSTKPVAQRLAWLKEFYQK